MPRRPPRRRGGGFRVSQSQLSALRQHLARILQLAKGIETDSEAINRLLPAVENKLSIWSRILWWAAVAAAIGLPLIGLIVLGYATGAFSVLRPLFGSIGSLFPTRANREADEDARAVAQGRISPDDPAIVQRRNNSERYRKRMDRSMRQRKELS